MKITIEDKGKEYVGKFVKSRWHAVQDKRNNPKGTRFKKVNQFIVLTPKGEELYNKINKMNEINKINKMNEIDLNKLSFNELKTEVEKLDEKVNEKLGKYVIVRTYSAGVFAGNLESRDGKEAVLLNARRLWYWNGAASLSQLAMEGVNKPEECKFPCEVKKITLTEVIEILDTTIEAEKNIKEVPIWEK